MSSDRQAYRVELTTEIEGATEQRTSFAVDQPPEVAFRIAVLGDFSGRGKRGPVATGSALAARRPIPIDRDNLDDVLARLAPELRIPARDGRSVHVVRFATLDDFHPDRLYERLPVFQSLREARDRAVLPPPMRPTARAPLASPPPRTVTGSGTLLDQILGDQPLPPGVALPEPSRAGSARAATDDALAEVIRRAVAPHVIADVEPTSLHQVAQIDVAIADEMRAILHDPDFQALEAAWRAVDFLIRRLDTDRSLRVELIDVSAAELSADVVGREGESAGGLLRLLVDSSTGAAPWAVLVGLFTFGPEPSDVETLRHLSLVARAANAPLFAAAHSRLVGTASFGTAPDVDDWADDDLPHWQALRRSDGARYVALAAPRCILRLPYGGRDGAPCDMPGFEELSDQRRHEDYLWGNPAVLCALLLGQAFSAEGWALRPSLEVGGLPLHLLREGAEVSAKPCAEALLSDRAVTRMLERGVIAVRSLKDGDAVRLARFQSIADPLAPIAGRWSVR